MMQIHQNNPINPFWGITFLEDFYILVLKLLL